MIKFIISIVLSAFSYTASAGSIMTVGDSLADGYGMVLPKWLSKSDSGWTSFNRGVTSSGLSASKPVEWSTKLPFLMNEYKPNVVIMSFGANDIGMPIKHNGKVYAFGSNEWAIEYISRTYSTIMTARAVGAVVIWMPIPEFKDATRERNAAYVRDIQDIVLRKTDTFKPDLRAVQTSRFKSTDGIHYNMTGYATAVDTALREAWNKTYNQ